MLRNIFLYALIFTVAVFSSAAEEAKSQKPKDTPPQEYLNPGETLELRMRWGIFSNVGSTYIDTVEETVEGLRQYRITIRSKSRGIADVLYPVTNNSETIIDAKTGRPLAVRTEGKSGKRLSKAMTLYDYQKGEVVHTDYVRADRNGTAKLPEEPAYDLMVAMLKARAWRLQPGESRDVLCSNEDDFYSITVTAQKIETVKTPLGKFEAVLIEPKQNGEPKGFFRRGGALKAWVSTEEKPQLVKLEIKNKSGTFVAVLAGTGAEKTPAPRADNTLESAARP